MRLTCLVLHKRVQDEAGFVKLWEATRGAVVQNYGQVITAPSPSPVLLPFSTALFSYVHIFLLSFI